MRLSKCVAKRYVIWSICVLTLYCVFCPLDGYANSGSSFSQLSHSSQNLSLFMEPTDPLGVTRVIDFINSATKSVDVVMYLMTQKDIENAIITAHDRGAAVHIIFEKNPYGGASNQSAINYLVSHGISRDSIHWGNSTLDLGAYTHEKLILIDAETDAPQALFGTFNMTGSAFTANREYGLIDTDASDIEEMYQTFQDDWNSIPVANNKLKLADLLWSPNNSRAKIRDLIQSARYSLVLEGEEMEDPAIENILKKISFRGVRVQVILPMPTDEKPLNPFEDSFVQIRYLKSGKGKWFLHAKMMVVDGKRAYVGSQNFSTNSLDNNRELGILIDDSSIIPQLLSTFEIDWNNATPLPPNPEPPAPGAAHASHDPWLKIAAILGVAMSGGVLMANDSSM